MCDIPQAAPLPSATPAGGVYKAPQSVALTSSEAGTIYYTTDGSAPSTSSPVYSEPGLNEST